MGFTGEVEPLPSYSYLSLRRNIKVIQILGAVIFSVIALVNVMLWLLGGCRLPCYVHWLALAAFLLGLVVSYEIHMISTSFSGIFWVPILFVGVVYVVFIVHGAGLPSTVTGLPSTVKSIERTTAMTQLVEASGEFEIEDLQPFLERVSRLIPSGFGEVQITQIVALALNMAVDDEEVRDFRIQYQEKNAILRLDVFMDDLGLPTVYFFAPPELAALITAEMNTFAEEREE